MSSATIFTVEERAALLRASRRQMDYFNEEVIRLHDLDGREGTAGGANRQMADTHSAELVHLASAVRKLWIASG